MTTTVIRKCDRCLRTFTNPGRGWSVLTAEDTGRTEDVCPRCTATFHGWSDPIVMGTGRRVSGRVA